jgi:hypothetical protein
MRREKRLNSAIGSALASANRSQAEDVDYERVRTAFQCRQVRAMFRGPVAALCKTFRRQVVNRV